MLLGWYIAVGRVGNQRFLRFKNQIANKVDVAYQDLNKALVQKSGAPIAFQSPVSRFKSRTKHDKNKIEHRSLETTIKRPPYQQAVVATWNDTSRRRIHAHG